ncbi:helix-turn-helix domain-containing protein [Sphingomonas sp. R1]|uniref:helix-turn-helix domain-containing protein n=1 Tax=Sphingomonas sp. R1 TaxID=399176 RepID=UPI0022242CD0|nr:helix-turn-helix transcriptional regulator [Sphingomonas sp. R1]UYY78919.1 helix-turn-helix domain-containing protein [Sphingomonas sp. R1]
MSLDQLAARTRIGRTHLEWIEGARFDRCGAPIYAIGFARAIARTLELAETPILASIRAGHAERAPCLQAPPRPVRRAAMPSLGLATTATLLLTLLGVVRG